MRTEARLTSSFVKRSVDMADENPTYVVFFDGVCSLCNRFVQFLFQRDRDEILYVAPLEGKTAEDLLPSKYRGDHVDSIVFMDRSGGEPCFYQKSDAVLRILPKLGGVWIGTKFLRWVPRAIRDAVYDFVANNRYDWFGKYDSCPAPEPEWKQRFLE